MGIPNPEHQLDHTFSEEERAAVYKTIYSRRDVRGQFKPDPIPDDVLARIIQAAHHAPSVGFMQPWNFLLIQRPETKKKIHDIFLAANEQAADMFEPEQSVQYKKLKLEGIIESPINLVITCDRDRGGSVILGRTHDKSMDLFSSVCAVQNLWLAARAEGVGLGWVSIFNKKALKQALKLPKSVSPVAYLCLGYVEHFYTEPELEVKGWRKRIPAEELLCFEEWGNTDTTGNEGLYQALADSNN
ncbi:5,6-dimethylbenzimidazole synthase [sulfur-oxidizing endosymbiont of Gigantopelta aegis]|uniref:5,6-dimethylbenzimidazole synthase n=1 Tax=sulfur-oxidizing endosymbiont of Gigantopelta aegis TaxID=2794934 RepID=UPI0018DC49C8|nr:5,6-dimethylbenzimidazole synthase [sulfur-oxidizing endosymbiont of Gigantopelta aegis]